MLFRERKPDREAAELSHVLPPWTAKELQLLMRREPLPSCHVSSVEGINDLHNRQLVTLDKHMCYSVHWFNVRMWRYLPWAQ